MDLPTLQDLPNHACNTSSSPGQLIHRQLMGKHQNGRGVTWISLKLGFGAFQLSESPHNTQILLIKVKFYSNNNTWSHHLSLSGSKRSLHSDFPISSHWQQPGEVFKDTRVWRASVLLSGAGNCLFDQTGLIFFGKCLWDSSWKSDPPPPFGIIAAISQEKLSG